VLQRRQTLCASLTGVVGPSAARLFSKDVTTSRWAHDLLYLQRMAATWGLLWCFVARALRDPLREIEQRSKMGPISSRSVLNIMNTRILVDSILWTNRREGHGRSLPSSEFTEINHNPCIERHTHQLQL